MAGWSAAERKVRSERRENVERIPALEVLPGDNVIANRLFAEWSVPSVVASKFLEVDLLVFFNPIICQCVGPYVALETPVAYWGQQESSAFIFCGAFIP